MPKNTTFGKQPSKGDIKETPKKATPKNKVKRVKKNKTTYTYILHDRELDLYKIGKTTAPIARFKGLCKRKRIMPVALAYEDVEERLHKEFAENRVTHPEYKYNGATEWFKKGGTFTSFIKDVQKSYYLPYITVHKMVEEMVEKGAIIINDPNTRWEINESDFAYYLIGKEILIMLDVIEQIGRSLNSKYPKHVLAIGQKLAVSDAIINRLMKKYQFFVSVDPQDPLITNSIRKKGSRARKITIESKEFNSEIYLLLTEL